MITSCYQKGGGGGGGAGGALIPKKVGSYTLCSGAGTYHDSLKPGFGFRVSGLGFRV